MRVSIFLTVAGVCLGLIGFLLIISGGCPFFSLFPPVLVEAPCELTQTGSIGLILGVLGGAIVVEWRSLDV